MVRWCKCLYHICLSLPMNPDRGRQSDPERPDGKSRACTETSLSPNSFEARFGPPQAAHSIGAGPPRRSRGSRASQYCPRRTCRPHTARRTSLAKEGVQSTANRTVRRECGRPTRDQSPSAGPIRIGRANAREEFETDDRDRRRLPPICTHACPRPARSMAIRCPPASTAHRACRECAIARLGRLTPAPQAFAEAA